jgi:hypothetical protein
MATIASVACRVSRDAEDVKQQSRTMVMSFLRDEYAGESLAAGSGV